MRGIAGLTAVRWPSRRKSAHPYRPQSITDALAALPPEPGPTFTARQPDPGRETRPIPGLAAAADAKAAPAGPEAAAPPVRPANPETALLARVHAALVRKWHAETFLADKRELPCFNATTKILGWQGLHMPPQAEGHRRWSTAGWAARERELADIAYMNARAQVIGGRSDISARVDDGLRAAVGGSK